MRVRLLGSAVADLEAGQCLYREYGEAVESHFLAVVFAEIDKLGTTGGCHFKVGMHHRVLTRPFSHAIYYRIAEEDVLVCRLLDCRRDPGWIAKQLKP